MSLIRYGIYLAYPPRVDLRAEGLGRYLAQFLLAAAERRDIAFTLVCPSWSRKSLDALFEAEGVPKDQFAIIAPSREPFLLRLHMWLDAYGKWRGRQSRLLRLGAGFRAWRGTFAEKSLMKLASTETFLGFAVAFAPVALLLLLSSVLLILVSPFLIALAALLLLRNPFLRAFGLATAPLEPFRRLLRSMLHASKGDAILLRMYEAMEKIECARMAALIEKMVEVKAWYCPTAFWPAFNQIRGPRLVCVPDVVLADFPAGFAAIGGERHLRTFDLVNKTIRSSTAFVCYSEAVKWNTLVAGFSVAPSTVSVVPHAPSLLDRWVKVRGTLDDIESTARFCQNQLITVFHRNKNHLMGGFLNRKVKFLFYASQMRPNKNVITLLRAYKHLLHKKFIDHKLILTGNRYVLPEVDNFITENHLDDDVIFVPGLSTTELASFYHLADLAVNPSLSEGGCPFTFTEALSVGTPVVMARIAVTEEVLTDLALQEATFFDPYDWNDLARRIEWALDHREELLALQKETYDRLANRTWRNVVDEHLSILDRIS